MNRGAEPGSPGGGEVGQDQHGAVRGAGQGFRAVTCVTELGGPTTVA